MLLADVQEFRDDLLARVGTVNEEQVVMVDPSSDEPASVVDGFVESDHALHIFVAEDRHVVFRGHSRFPPLLRLNWPHEGQEEVRYDPVHVPVLHPLIIFVLLDVEGLQVVPTMSDGKSEALQTVENSALVVALPFRGISEGNYSRVVEGEARVSVFGRDLEDGDHEGAHEEEGVGQGVWFIATIMENLKIFILLVLNFIILIHM